MLQKLKTLYPDDYVDVHKKLRALIDDYKTKIMPGLPKFSEKDIVLITFADQVQEDHVDSLKTLHKFLNSFVKGLVNKIHILPFFPFSNDRGFAVIDYYNVHKAYGDWQDIKDMSDDFEMMFDLVINHVSEQSEWFKGFMDGDERNYILSFDSPVDTTSVFRPRSEPVLKKVTTAKGERWVWETFPLGQADLNFWNPDVFLEMMNILMYYIEKGAKVIRLDAIAFIWKQLGTTCVHRPETHLIVKLIREVIDEVAPQVWIISETNVEHRNNISYFGNDDEAHLVYNFTLPPLMLYTLINGDSTELSKWAQTLKASEKTAFFNFTASHDGIGVRPLTGVLPDSAIDELVLYTKQHGGQIGQRIVEGKQLVPYELNISYHSALRTPARFLASQAVMLTLKGVPGIYFNSLFGAENCVPEENNSRGINEKKFEYSELVSNLTEHTKMRTVYEGYRQLLKARINEPLFSPYADQEILMLDKRVFALTRGNDEKLLSLTNVTDSSVTLNFGLIGSKAIDIISGRVFDCDITLGPYQTAWLKQVS